MRCHSFDVINLVFQHLNIRFYINNIIFIFNDIKMVRENSNNLGIRNYFTKNKGHHKYIDHAVYEANGLRKHASKLTPFDGKNSILILFFIYDR